MNKVRSVIKRKIYLKLLPLLVAGLCMLAGSLQAAGPSRPIFGDTRLFATVPTGDGSPEGVAVNGRTVYVSTPADLVTAGLAPSKILAFDIRSGQLIEEFVIQGEDLTRDHETLGLAFDGEDRLYALNSQLGVIRINVANGRRLGQQEVYASPLPKLPPCSEVGATPCAPKSRFGDRPPLPNDLVFDNAGNLYVTDSLQATIWRIPPGGGVPQIWFQDSRLETLFGPNGIRLNPARTLVYFVVTVPGIIYTLPLTDRPASGDLRVFHQFDPSEGPDDMVFGMSGRLYVSLSTSNQIGVLSPDGETVATFPSAQQNKLLPIPIDAPANLAFDNRTASLLIANHAIFSKKAADYAVLESFVNDREDLLSRPIVP